MIEKRKFSIEWNFLYVSIIRLSDRMFLIKQSQMSKIIGGNLRDNIVSLSWASIESSFKHQRKSSSQRHTFTRKQFMSKNEQCSNEAKMFVTAFHVLSSSWSHWRLISFTIYSKNLIRAILRLTITTRKSRKESILVFFMTWFCQWLFCNLNCSFSRKNSLFLASLHILNCS